MAETTQKKITLSNFFEQIVEINKISQRALERANQSVSISEKNKLDLERLIQTLQINVGDKLETVNKEDKSEDTELRDSFNILKANFDRLSASFALLEINVNALTNAYVGDQQRKKKINDQTQRQLAATQDKLQKDPRTFFGVKPESKGGALDATKSGILDKTKKTLKQFFAGVGLSAAGAALSTLTGPPGEEARVPTSGGAPVADVSKDVEFQKEVQSLAKETGSKPSELMAMYNAEAPGINTKAQNKSGATGIFQLMFDPKNPEDRRYGYTRQEFMKLSRADQVRIHRQYLKDAGVKPGGHQGIQSVHVANFAPAYLGSSPDTVLYKKPSAAYENNKNIDLIYGNKDGRITIKEYSNFINKSGGVRQFEKYDKPAAQSVSQVTPAGEPVLVAESRTPQATFETEKVKREDLQLASKPSIVELPPTFVDARKTPGGMSSRSPAPSTDAIPIGDSSSTVAAIFALEDRLNKQLQVPGLV